MVLVCTEITFLMHVMKTNLTGDTGALNRAIFSLFLYVTRAGVIGINPSISGKYKTFLSHNLIFHSIVLLLCWSPSLSVSLFNVK